MKSNIIYKVARYLLGALFLFSGFAKGVNPFGLSLQFDSYFTAMGLEVLARLGVLGAIVLPALEIWLGLLLVFGFSERFTRWAVGMAMLFFTGFTLWIAIENPVEDCRCFGELWKISNWATFYKNVLFLVAALFFWWYTPRRPKGAKRLGHRVAGLGLAIVAVGLPLWCWTYGPLIETSAWAVGSDVRAEMRSTLQEETISQVVYRHRSTGDEQSFALTDTTWHDETAWEYVRTETQSRTFGHQGALVDVGIVEPRTNRNVARELFDTPGTLFLMILPDPDALGSKQLERLRRIVEGAHEARILVVCITSAPGVEIPFGMSYLMADRSLLHTMMPNAVGGLVEVKNGVITRKIVVDLL